MLRLVGSCDLQVEHQGVESQQAVRGTIDLDGAAFGRRRLLGRAAAVRIDEGSSTRTTYSHSHSRFDDTAFDTKPLKSERALRPSLLTSPDR
jgi:hypothetical protein